MGFFHCDSHIGDLHHEFFNFLLLLFDSFIDPHKHGLLHLQFHRGLHVLSIFELVFDVLTNELNLCAVSDEKLDTLLEVKLTVAVFVNHLELFGKLSLHLLGDGARLGTV